MMWRNEFIARSPRLAFIQSISAGTDQYDREEVLAAAGIRLASAQGVNAEAVAQHAMALILALARQLHLARDNQARRHWRGMISDLSQREDELAGKTLLIVGLGRIGSRLAALARAFGMHTLATKRDASTGADAADAAFPQERLRELLPQADIVALTCPLTPQTQGLIGAQALAAMKPSAMLVNVARGRVVDEAALVEALAGRRIAAAGIDCTVEEPLPAASPLWALDNALITPQYRRLVPGATRTTSSTCCWRTWSGSGGASRGCAITSCDLSARRHHPRSALKSSFRGPNAAREPGFDNYRLRLWIPGSRRRSRVHLRSALNGAQVG